MQQSQSQSNKPDVMKKLSVCCSGNYTQPLIQHRWVRHALSSACSSACSCIDHHTQCQLRPSHGVGRDTITHSVGRDHHTVSAVCLCVSRCCVMLKWWLREWSIAVVGVVTMTLVMVLAFSPEYHMNSMPMSYGNACFPRSCNVT